MDGTFLKIDTGNSQFAQIGDTPAQAAEPGGRTPDAFFGRHGDVVSGAQAVIADADPVQLLALPGDIILVDASLVADGALTLTIHNGTAAAMRAVQSLDGTTDAPITLSAAQDTALTVGSAASPHRLHLQIFPSGQALPDVVSMIVSSEPSADAGPLEVVGQAFTGSAG